MRTCKQELLMAESTYCYEASLIKELHPMSQPIDYRYISYLEPPKNYVHCARIDQLADSMDSNTAESLVFSLKHSLIGFILPVRRVLFISAKVNQLYQAVRVTPKAPAVPLNNTAQSNDARTHRGAVRLAHYHSPPERKQPPGSQRKKIFVSQFLLSFISVLIILSTHIHTTVLVCLPR